MSLSFLVFRRKKKIVGVGSLLKQIIRQIQLKANDLIVPRVNSRVELLTYATEAHIKEK